MSSFTEMVVSPIAGTFNWVLKKEFIYYIGELGSQDKIIVPAGFQTDFGSVPRCLWGLVPPIGPAIGPYLIHDYLYATQERSRLVSDAVLLEALEIAKVNFFQRKLIYRGVRIGGWLAWGQNKKKIKNGQPTIKMDHEVAKSSSGGISPLDS